MQVFHAFETWLRTGLQDSWYWVQGLDLQGWLLVLGAGSAAGFLCMRGFGSRTNY